MPHSPGSKAELIPHYDYILGTAEEEFHYANDLQNVLTANVDKQVTLYVYNSQSDMVRKCIISPSASWGGEGISGVEIGTGQSHKLPYECRMSCGKTLFAVDPSILMVNNMVQIDASSLPRPSPPPSTHTPPVSYHGAPLSNRPHGSTRGPASARGTRRSGNRSTSGGPPRSDDEKTVTITQPLATQISDHYQYNIGYSPSPLSSPPASGDV